MTRSPSPPTGPVPPERGDTGVRPLTVAIVDDQKAMTELLTEVLGDEGIRAVPVASPDEAVATTAAVGADVVLLDVLMRDLSGWEVLRRLRADPATREMPVIVISAVYDRPGLRPLPAGGPVRFVAKPFDIATLIATVRGLAS